MKRFYKIKEDKLEDFKKKATKLGFIYLDSMNVYQHKDGFKHGELWVYPQTGEIEPTFYGDYAKATDPIIKHLLSQGLLEVYYEN